MPIPPTQRPHVALYQAADDDLEALVAIRIEAMRESLERVGRFDPDRARARFLSGFDAACTRRMEVSGELVGFVVVKPLQDGLLLDHLYVIPSAQGTGIGSEVLAQVFREADEQRRSVSVGALKQSASNRFYIRHGFEFIESGEFDNYYVRTNPTRQRT